MAANWFVQVMGEKLGPLDDDQLREMVAKRQLTPDDLIRKITSASWVPASRVRGLFDQAAVPSTVVVAPTTPPPLPTNAKGATNDSGSEVSAPAFVELTEPLHPQLIACPDCGKRISPNANSCPNCGHSFFRPNRSVAIALAWILGGIGVHKFYLRKPGDGIAALLFCWTFIPAIFAIVEGFQYLSMDEEAFARKFGSTSGAKLGSPSQVLQSDLLRRPANRRRWIGWGVVVFVLLAIVGAIVDPDHGRVGHSVNSAVATGNWYEGGTLRDKGALDWQVA